MVAQYAAVIDLTWPIAAKIIFVFDYSYCNKSYSIRRSCLL
jgi:hypothetical protein